MTRIALIAAFGLLLFASSAQADSIVYIKNGDVWLANAKGKRQKAIARNGTPANPYRAPAYSNAGVITAVRGRGTIRFFNRRGKKVRRARDITGGPTPPNAPVIIDQAISPDGKRLASTLWLTTRDATPKPGEPTGTDYGTTVWYTNAKNGKLLPGTTDGARASPGSATGSRSSSPRTRSSRPTPGSSISASRTPRRSGSRTAPW